MYIKIHKSYRTVVAICDAELINKKFEEGKRQLDARENFYKDKQINEKEAIEIMIRQAREDATFNIVGKKSVEAALKAGIITQESISYVQQIPFALKLL